MARPREHPDADLLADLAAEVLPEDLARRVEAHVVDCEHCADQLAEAEGIRSLLRRQEPPAMPEDVADRIGTVLAELRLGPAAGEREGLGDDPDADARWAAAAARGAVGGARGRRQVPKEETALGAGSEFAVRRKVERGREASVTRLRRVTSGPARLRRQALEEQRSAERAGRVGKLLLGTAAAVLAIVAGGLGLRALESGSLDGADSLATSSQAEDSGGPAAPEAAGGGGTGGGVDSGGVREFSAAGAPVLATGANYTDATLAAQAKQLLAAATLAQRAAAGKAADATGQPRPQPQAGVSQSPGVAAAAGNGSLRDPAALRACLGALNAADQQVVAVDLARFNGRDSAVIVLRASGGEYDVWVVARDCRPGADGTVKYVSMGP